MDAPDHENEGERIEMHLAPDAPSRNRRAAAALGAAVLIAAAGGVGFGIGRGVEGSGASAPDDDSVPVTVAPLGEEDRAASSESSDETLPEAATAAEVIDPTPDEMGDAAFSSVSSLEGAGWSMHPGFGDAEAVVDRTTDAGITVRAHLIAFPEDELVAQYDSEFDGWAPPAWCRESGQARLALAGGEATGESVIDVGAVSWWEQPFEGRAVSSVTLGRIDANPHRVVFVQATDGTTSVSVTFSDGSTDAVDVVDGLAVLVVAGAPESIVREEDGGYTWIEERPEFTVSFSGPGAGEDVVVDGRLQFPWNDPEYVASCSPPPPALPEAGEQPADADAARGEIDANMAALYGDADGEQVGDALDLVDDPTGVAEAREQVAQGSFEEAAAAAEAIIEELVFVAPTDARFRYRIETTTGVFGDRFGQANLIDGTWKISRSTLCQDLGLAGGSCDGHGGAVSPTADESGD